MIVKLPARDVTFIVLANSDGLTRIVRGSRPATPPRRRSCKLFLRFFAP